MNPGRKSKNAQMLILKAKDWRKAATLIGQISDQEEHELYSNGMQRPNEHGTVHTQRLAKHKFIIFH